MEIIIVLLGIAIMILWDVVNSKKSRKEMEKYNDTIVEELEKDLRHYTKIIMDSLNILYINDKITYEMEMINNVFKETNRAFETIDLSKELYKGGNVNIINAVNINDIISLEEKVNFEKYRNDSSKDEVRIITYVKSSIVVAKELKLKEDLGV